MLPMFDVLKTDYWNAKEQLDVFLKNEIVNIQQRDLDTIMTSHERRESLFQHHFNAIHSILSYCQTHTDSSKHELKNIYAAMHQTYGLMDDYYIALDNATQHYNHEYIWNQGVHPFQSYSKKGLVSS